MQLIEKTFLILIGKVFVYWGKIERAPSSWAGSENVNRLGRQAASESGPLIPRQRTGGWLSFALRTASATGEFFLEIWSIARVYQFSERDIAFKTRLNGGKLWLFISDCGSSGVDA